MSISIMLHELSRPLSYKRKWIQIGRGNGSGKWNYSTKGLKGQRARTGFSQKPGFEWGQTPLHMRLPKSRWFKKYFKLVKHTVAINVNILDADDRISSGFVVSLESLTQLWYGKRWHGFKILGNGELTKSIVVENIPVSATAKKIIENVWGSIV